MVILTDEEHIAKLRKGKAVGLTLLLVCLAVICADFLLVYLLQSRETAVYFILIGAIVCFASASLFAYSLFSVYLPYSRAIGDLSRYAKANLEEISGICNNDGRLTTHSGYPCLYLSVHTEQGDRDAYVPAYFLDKANAGQHVRLLTHNGLVCGYGE